MTPIPSELLAAGSPQLAPSADLADLIAILRAVEPPDHVQGAVRDQMLDFAATHPDALHRSCLEGHFTGSAVVMEEGSGRMLVLFHSKLQKWLQPGGHTDGDATMAATALREATEETGLTTLRTLDRPIDLDIHEVRPPNEAPHLHLDIRYLVVAAAGSVPVGNHESEAIRWVTEDELDDLGVDASVSRLMLAGRHAARGLR